MGSRVRRVRQLGGAGAVVCGVAWSAALGAVSAHAAEGLVVAPASVLPGAAVSVDGRCPEPVGSDFVRATVAVPAIGRQLVVPVADGAFHADLTIAAVGPVDAPESRVAMPLTATCMPGADGAAAVAARRLRVAAVGQVESVGNATVPTGASAGRDAAGQSIPLSVPLGALSVAVLASVGAIVLNSRSDRRSAAMARHPAQRGVGRDPRRARR